MIIKDWLLVVIVTGVLSWMALGHHGPSNVQKYALMPLSTNIDKVKCLVAHETCPRVPSTIRSLFFDTLGNIVVFIPIGWVVARASKESANSLLFAVVYGCALSISFEIIQIWLPGRVVATDDVLLNTFGSWLGAKAAKPTIIIDDQKPKSRIQA